MPRAKHKNRKKKQQSAEPGTRTYGGNVSPSYPSENPGKKGKRKGRRRSGSFISNADTRDMREYQQAAAKYPPLPKREFIEVSKVFVDGRRAGILLKEHDLIDKALGGDWSAESIDENHEAAISAIDDYATDGKATGVVPKDVYEILFDDLEQATRTDESYRLFIRERDFDDDQTAALKRRMSRGDVALEKMVNHNLTFAMNRVGRMMRRNKRAKMIGVTELIATANIGLLLGARQYDPSTNRAFTTYAAFHIDGQLYDYLNREDGNVGIKSATPHEQKQIVELGIATMCFKERYGREATIAELSSITGIAPSLVEKRLKTPTVRTQSIYVDANGGDADGDRQVFLPDMMESKDSVEEELNARDRDDTIERLHGMIAKLPELQRKVMLKVFGFENNEPMTPGKIGNELNLSTRQVNGVLDEALARMRKMLEESDIDMRVLMEMIQE